MNESQTELIEIKKDIIKEAVYHYRMNDLENDIVDIDFDNKLHIHLILRKFRALGTITNTTKKIMLNQMIVHTRNVPDMEIDPYVIPKEKQADFDERADKIIKEKERKVLAKEYKPTKIMDGEMFIEPIIEETIIEEPVIEVPITNEYYHPITEKVETIEEIEFKYPIQKIPIVSKIFITKKKRASYYCKSCKYNHFNDSKIGINHKNIIEPQIKKEKEFDNELFDKLIGEITVEDMIDKMTFDEMYEKAYNGIELAEMFIELIKNTK